MTIFIRKDDVVAFDSISVTVRAKCPKTYDYIDKTPEYYPDLDLYLAIGGNSRNKKWIERAMEYVADRNYEGLSKTLKNDDPMVILFFKDKTVTISNKIAFTTHRDRWCAIGCGADVDRILDYIPDMTPVKAVEFVMRQNIDCGSIDGKANLMVLNFKGVENG